MRNYHWQSDRPAGPRRLANGDRCVRPKSLAANTGRLHAVLSSIPGLLIFAAFFVPWMMAVARQHEHAWQLWNWQYLQRAAGDYEDSKPRGAAYYLTYVAGFTLPWLFLLPEAFLAPWLRQYARWHVRCFLRTMGHRRHPRDVHRAV